MRSFAVIAGFAAYVNAAAYGYPAVNSTTPCATATSTPAYPVYEASKPAYNEYPVSTPAYEYKPYQVTKVVYGLTTYCPEPTTITYGYKTYTVKSATTIVDTDCSYTTTYWVKPTSTPCPTAKSTAVPYQPQPPAPAVNSTKPYATGVVPSYSKPAPPTYTGAAAQAGVGLVAAVAAVAAFL